MELLQTGLNSEGLIGEFFVKCLSHFNSMVTGGPSTGSTGVHGSTDSCSNTHGLDHAPVSPPSSSALLACEATLPASSAEVCNGAALLHTIAALCEHMSDSVLSQSHLPSLLAACGDTLACHAKALEGERGEGEVRFSSREPAAFEERVVGGAVSLNIVFGLLSAVLAGARKVS